MNTAEGGAAPRTAFAKMWDEHVITRLGDADLLQIDRLVLHELSGSQVMHALQGAGREPACRNPLTAPLPCLGHDRGQTPCDTYP